MNIFFNQWNNKTTEKNHKQQSFVWNNQTKQNRKTEKNGNSKQGATHKKNEIQKNFFIKPLPILAVKNDDWQWWSLGNKKKGSIGQSNNQHHHHPRKKDVIRLVTKKKIHKDLFFH